MNPRENARSGEMNVTRERRTEICEKKAIKRTSSVLSILRTCCINLACKSHGERGQKFPERFEVLMKVLMFLSYL